MHQEPSSPQENSLLSQQSNQEPEKPLRESSSANNGSKKIIHDFDLNRLPDDELEFDSNNSILFNTKNPFQKTTHNTMERSKREESESAAVQEKPRFQEFIQETENPSQESTRKVVVNKSALADDSEKTNIIKKLKDTETEVDHDVDDIDEPNRNKRLKATEENRQNVDDSEVVKRKFKDKFPIQKMISKSDLSGFNRLILTKNMVEMISSHLTDSEKAVLDDSTKDLPLKIFHEPNDNNINVKEYNVIIKKMSNGRQYGLVENWKTIVKDMGIEEGDTFGMYCTSNQKPGPRFCFSVMRKIVFEDQEMFIKKFPFHKKICLSDLNRRRLELPKTMFKEHIFSQLTDEQKKSLEETPGLTIKMFYDEFESESDYVVQIKSTSAGKYFLHDNWVKILREKNINAGDIFGMYVVSDKPELQLCFSFLRL